MNSKLHSLGGNCTGILCHKFVGGIRARFSEKNLWVFYGGVRVGKDGLS